MDQTVGIWQGTQTLTPDDPMKLHGLNQNDRGIDKKFAYNIEHLGKFIDYCNQHEASKEQHSTITQELVLFKHRFLEECLSAVHIIGPDGNFFAYPPEANKEYESYHPADITHPATCDNCHKSIQAVRYRCVDCADYDLCYYCFQDASVFHPGHSLEPIYHPISVNSTSYGPESILSLGFFREGCYFPDSIMSLFNDDPDQNSAHKTPFKGGLMFPWLPRKGIDPPYWVCNIDAKKNPAARGVLHIRCMGLRLCGSDPIDAPPPTVPLGYRYSGQTLVEHLHNLTYPKRDYVASSLYVRDQPKQQDSPAASANSIDVFNLLNQDVADKIYSQLDNTQIRLLKIQRGDNSRIECSLTTHTLEEAEFEALSYVWGSQSDAAMISLCGNDFQVTQNLYKALSRLRSAPAEVFFWVDALCINQLDLLERAVQVPRMRDIYSKARRTLIWLGEIPPHIEGFLDRVRDSFKRFYESGDSHVRFKGHDLRKKEFWPGHDVLQRVYKLYHSILDLDTNVTSFENGLTHSHEEQVSKTMSYMASVAEHPYWLRVWIVQELIYSRVASIIYGQSCVDLVDYYEFCKAIIQTHPAIEEPYDYRNIKPWCISQTPVEDFVKELKFGPGTAANARLIDAEDWFARFSRRHCSEPRDLVFGFYGCFSPSVTHQIMIDYRQSTHQVFSQMCKILIGQSKSLEMVIQQAYVRNGKSNLPSWVPDFTTPPKKCPVPFGKVYEPYTITRVGELITNPSEKSKTVIHHTNPPIIEISEGGDVLHVQAIKIGKVHRVGKRFAPLLLVDIPDPDSAFSLGVSGKGEYLTQSALELISNPTQIHQFVSALWGPKPQLPTDTLQPYLVQLLEAWFKKLGPKWTDQSEIYLPPDLNLMESTGEIWIDQFLHAGRMMFVLLPFNGTDCGMDHFSQGKIHEFGIGCRGMKPGDTIFLIFGYPWPIIARPVDSTSHVLVGDAYLPKHQFQTAEMLEEYKAKFSHWQDSIETLCFR
jgi:hypothetical protein